MKKSSLQSLVSYLNGETITNIDEIKAEIEAELAKDVERKQANAEAYEAAKPIILGALSDTPVTLGELYDEVADDLPDGFTKGKVQYAVTRLWCDEITKVEGKVNSYTRKA
jgi:hypothetical protein